MSSKTLKGRTEKATINLEQALCAYARPTFLAITKPDEDNDIQIVISCLAFETMTVQERINYVFGIIRKYSPDSLNDRLIIVQAYTSDEMERVLFDLFLPEFQNDNGEY